MPPTKLNKPTKGTKSSTPSTETEVKDDSSYVSRRNVTETYVNKAVEEAQEKILCTFTNQLALSIDALKSSIIENLVNENKMLAKKVKKLEAEIDYIHDRLYETEINVNDNQQRSRRNNIEIHGINNDILDEDLEDQSLAIMNMIVQNKLSKDDIEACHRLPGKGIKPVVIKFINRKRCDDVFSNGMKLAEVDVINRIRSELSINNRLYVNRNLSPTFKMLSYHCRRLRKEGLIAKIMFENSKLKIKLNEEGGWIKVNHEQEIMELFPKYDFNDSST